METLSEIKFNEILEKLIKFNYNGFLFNFLSNDQLGMGIINDRIWEPHILMFLKQNLTNNSIFLDIGSFYGWHSIINANFCKEIYSFEPQEIMVEIQKININNNNIKNIKIYHCAIGEENKISHLQSTNYLGEFINFGDISVNNDNNGEKIEIRTIDSFNFSQVDIIKIDAQGYEKFILNGMIKTINNFNPILIIEVEHFQLSKFGYTPKELFELIKNLGYKIYFLDYFYPADFVCVHNNNLNSFLLQNKQFIYPLEENNDLNMCLDYDINEKIFYNDVIKNNNDKNLIV